MQEVFHLASLPRQVSVKSPSDTTVHEMLHLRRSGCVRGSGLAGKRRAKENKTSIATTHHEA
jgi:hypothetical protein